MAPVNKSWYANRKGPNPYKHWGNQVHNRSIIKQGIDFSENPSYKDRTRCVSRWKAVLIWTNTFEIIRFPSGWSPAPSERLQQPNNKYIKKKSCKIRKIKLFPKIWFAVAYTFLRMYELPISRLTDSCFGTSGWRKKKIKQTGIQINPEQDT